MVVIELLADDFSRLVDAIPPSAIKLVEGCGNISCYSDLHLNGFNVGRFSKDASAILEVARSSGKMVDIGRDRKGRLSLQIYDPASNKRQAPIGQSKFTLIAAGISPDAIKMETHCGGFGCGATVLLNDAVISQYTWFIIPSIGYSKDAPLIVEAAKASGRLVDLGRDENDDLTVRIAAKPVQLGSPAQSARMVKILADDGAIRTSDKKKAVRIMRADND